MKIIIFGWNENIINKSVPDHAKIFHDLIDKKCTIFTDNGINLNEIYNKNISYDDTLNKINSNINIKKTNNSNFYDDVDLFIFFPGKINIIYKFTKIIKLIDANTQQFKNTNIILCNKKYWYSLIAWFEFNEIQFPHKYITSIINSTETFKNIINQLKPTKQIFLEKTKQIDNMTISIPFKKGIDTQYIHKFINTMFSTMDNTKSEIISNKDNEIKYKISIIKKDQKNDVLPSDNDVSSSDNNINNSNNDSDSNDKL
jgi:hypothetical protein